MINWVDVDFFVKLMIQFVFNNAYGNFNKYTYNRIYLVVYAIVFYNF